MWRPGARPAPNTLANKDKRGQYGVFSSFHVQHMCTLCFAGTACCRCVKNFTYPHCSSTVARGPTDRNSLHMQLQFANRTPHKPRHSTARDSIPPMLSFLCGGADFVLAASSASAFSIMHRRWAHREMIFARALYGSRVGTELSL